MSKGKGLAGLLFVLGADIRSFQTEMRKATRDMQTFGKNMMDVGKDLSKYATVPFTAFATGAVMSFRTVNEAMKQVEAGLISTGGAAGFTGDQLQKMAKQAGDVANVFSADILKDVTAQLLTFTNVTGPTFERAQMSILDVSARMGTDMKSSAIMIGKALNDPIQGLTALRRVGIQFSDQQQEMIKSMNAAGDAAGAQAVILEELERQFGGSAAASGDAFTQMGNAAKELGASFGELIHGFLTPFIRNITALLNHIAGLTEKQKSWVLGIGGVMAAIGPLMIAIGFMAKSVIPSLISGLAATKIAFAKLTAVMMANPYVAVGAAIAAIAAGMLLFRSRTDDAADSQWRLGKALRDVNQELGKQIYDTLAIGAKKATDGSLQFTGSLKNLQDNVKSLTKQELESLKMYLEHAIPEAARAAANSASELEKAILNQDLESYRSALAAVVGELGKFTDKTTELSGSVGIIGSLENQLKSLRDLKAAATTTEEIARLNDEIKRLEERIKSLNELTERVASIPMMQSQSAKPLEYDIDTRPAELSLRRLSDTTIALGEQVGDVWRSIGDETYAMALAITDGINIIGEQLVNVFTGVEASFTGVVSSMLNGIQQIINGLLVKAIAGMIAGEATRGLPGLIMAGIGVAAIRAMWPKMATGGIVPPGFPNDTYPALLSSGEKVIPAPMPLSGLSSTPEAITVNVVGKLQGNELLLVTERARGIRTQNIGR
jgi:hypothetical protein